MIVTDEAGREIEVHDSPARIVSLVPSATETLFWLGAGARIAGVTDYCNRPDRARSLPRVGGVRDPNLAAIAALKPDLVVASLFENAREDVEALEKASIPVYVTAPSSVRGALDSFKALALVSAAPPAARKKIRMLESEVRDLARSAPPRTAEVLAVVWPDPVVCPGRGTFTADLLRFSGARSVAEDLEGPWPRPDGAFLASAAIDAVILTTEPHPFTESDALEWRGRKLAFRGKPAAFVVDGEAVNRPGPRFAGGIRLVRAAISGLSGGG